MVVPDKVLQDTAATTYDVLVFLRPEMPEVVPNLDAAKPADPHALPCSRTTASPG